MSSEEQFQQIELYPVANEFATTSVAGSTPDQYSTQKPQQQFVYVMPIQQEQKVPLLPKPLNTNNNGVQLYPSNSPKKKNSKCCCVCASMLCCLLMFLVLIVGGTAGFGYYLVSNRNLQGNTVYSNFSAPFTSIYGEFSQGDITFSRTSSPTPVVQITKYAYFGELVENVQLNYVVNDDTLTMSLFDYDNTWYNSFQLFKQIKVDIQLPYSDFQLNDISLLVDGSVTVNLLQGSSPNRFQIIGHHGDVDIQNLYANEVDISTTTGEIKIQNIYSNDISLSSTDGDIHLLNVVLQNSTMNQNSTSLVIKATGHGNIKKLSESIYLSSSEIHNTLDFETNSGNIDLEIHYSKRCFVKANSNNGRTSSNGVVIDNQGLSYFYGYTSLINSYDYSYTTSVVAQSNNGNVYLNFLYHF